MLSTGDYSCEDFCFEETKDYEERFIVFLIHISKEIQIYIITQVKEIS